MERRNGFTLIELLVVIAIIAILTAILFPVNENNWELSPNPDPKNRKINGAPGCQYVVPPGPDSAAFQTPPCLAYQ